jgi:hypothetical protein
MAYNSVKNKSSSRLHSKKAYLTHNSVLHVLIQNFVEIKIHFITSRATESDVRNFIFMKDFEGYITRTFSLLSGSQSNSIKRKTDRQLFTTI